MEREPALLQSVMVVDKLQRALHIKNSVKCREGKVNEKHELFRGENGE